MNYDSTQGHKNNLRATYYAYPLLCICKEWKCKLFVGSRCACIDARFRGDHDDVCAKSAEQG